jgi:hypothetical protein
LVRSKWSSRSADIRDSILDLRLTFTKLNGAAAYLAENSS